MYYRRKKKNSEKKVFTEIFKKVYSKLECKIIYVFLCGGACKDGSNEIRDQIRKLLEKLSGNKIQVLYPENLFFEKNGKQLTEFFTKKDLLELETILAHNANVICVICESMGSATELGAFTNYKIVDENILLDKLVTVIYRKYAEMGPSFISEGPIKRIKNKDKSKYKIYELKKYTKKSTIPMIQKELAQNLIIEFNKICKQNNKNDLNKIFLKPSVKLNNFIGLSYLILLLIYFYKNLTNEELTTILKIELDALKIVDFKNKEEQNKFDGYYKMSKGFLINIQKLLIKDGDKAFILTKKGFDFLKKHVLKNINIETNEMNYIRTRILHNQLYKKKGDYAS